MCILRTYIIYVHRYNIIIAIIILLYEIGMHMARYTLQQYTYNYEPE